MWLISIFGPKMIRSNIIDIKIILKISMCLYIVNTLIEAGSNRIPYLVRSPIN